MTTDEVELNPHKLQVDKQDLLYKDVIYRKVMIRTNMHEDTAMLRQFYTNVHWQEFVCGWSAAFINIFMTYPINKILFRQMIHGVGMGSAFGQLRNEGLSFLYRGVLPPLLQKTCSLSIMFGVYEEVKRPLLEQHHVNKYLAKAAGGVLSGATEAILMPFERVQALLINSTFHQQYRNTFQAFKVIGFNYGFKEYYRGLVPILLRNCPANVCFFIIREEVQEQYPDQTTPFETVVYNFITGACIGAALSSTYYPLNVIKLRMQSRVGGKFENLFKVIKQIYTDRGSKISNLYIGVSTNVTRAFLSWGIMSVAYEFMKRIVY